MVHPDVLQLVPLLARSQRPGLVTPPGLVARAPRTKLLAKAELFVGILSQLLDITPVKVTVVPLAETVGITGIRSVSSAKLAIVVVLLQVTVTPICAPHDQPLSVKELPGPFTLAGRVSTNVCTPLEEILHPFVTVTGI